MRLARVLALLTALVAALPLGAFGESLLFCRPMNRVMSSCCCQHRPSAEEPKAPRFERGACCERIESGSHGVVSAVREGVLRFEASLAATLAPPFELETLPFVRAVTSSQAQARAPPRAGPPLYIQHCSLLT